MKKFYLLFVGLLLSVTATQASEKSYQIDGSENGLTNRYRYAQPIQFVERGVEFFVFPNGEFDFNTHPIAYNRTRRGTVNVTYGAPRVQIRANRNIGVRIEHDLNGRVRRIGNTFINYDRIGRVKRIGSVYMGYHNNRHGLLRQIGGMRLKYNRWGRLVRQFGTVKPQRVNIGGNIHIGDDFDDDHDLPAHDDDLYYYKKNNKKIKKSQKRK